MKFETIDEVVPGSSKNLMNNLDCHSNVSLVRQSLNETTPFSIRDSNLSLDGSQPLQSDVTPKNSKKDKFEALGLASKLIMNILEAAEADESLQLSILDECKFLIESRRKKTKRLVHPNTGNTKLRQAVKKYSNKENNSMEYEIALSNIQDIFKHKSAK